MTFAGSCTARSDDALVDPGQATHGSLPVGVVTFLFTDIEESTTLVQAIGDTAYSEVLDAHNGIMRAAITERGTVVKTIGDSFFGVFPEPFDGIEAAIRIQRDLAAAPTTSGIRVRMGLHSATAVLGGDDYVGLDVHRCARIADAANGGQILVSSTTQALVDRVIPEGTSLQDLGRHRLKDLSEPEVLFQVCADGLERDFPRLRTVEAVSGNLPAQPNTFVGRASEVADVVGLLEGSRAVTLTGPGGTGKTRLALDVAQKVVGSFNDGAYFVALEAVTDPDLIPTTIISALGLPAARAGLSPTDHLTRYLEDKQLLLVLDNFEQIVDSAALVASLIVAAPRTKILVTSRVPLRIQGEREYKVPPLSVPDLHGPVDAEAVTSSEGVQLFAARAGAVRPDFEITDENAETIATLVAQLDGLPLAIELAASRVGLLSPTAMLDRLDNRLLASSAPGLPARQQTIANAIGWSYDLLPDHARLVFERFSVFVGDAALEDIEVVCASADDTNVDVLESLGTLVDHSLIRPVWMNGEARYRMLTVIREYAYAALVARGEDDATRRRHGLQYCRLVATAEPFLLTSKQTEWISRLAADVENLRAAMDWTLEVDEDDLALTTVGNMWRFWQIRGMVSEARERIDRTLRQATGSPLARAKALEADGGIAYWQGEWAKSKEPYVEALALVRAHGSDAQLANALYNAAFPIAFDGDQDLANQHLRESLAISESLGDRLGVGRAHWGLGGAAQYVYDYAATIDHMLLAAAEFEPLDAPFDLGWTYAVLADAYLRVGEVADARTNIDLASYEFAGSEDLSAAVLILQIKSYILSLGGDDVAGAMALGAAMGLKRETGLGITDVEANQHERGAELLADTRPEVKQALEAGMNLTVGEALALAESI